MLLYLAANTVYALAMLARRHPGNGERPGEQACPRRGAPIAEIAARQLFGPRWSNPLSLAIGLMLLSTSVPTCFGSPGDLCDGQGRPVSGDRGPVDPYAGTPAVATALQVAMTLILLWTGTFEHRGLRKRGAVALLHAVHEFDLRSPMEAAGTSPSVPDPRVPGNPRALSAPDGHVDRRGFDLRGGFGRLWPAFSPASLSITFGRGSSPHRRRRKLNERQN